MWIKGVCLRYTKNRDLSTWMDGGGNPAVPIFSIKRVSWVPSDFFWYFCPKMRGVASRA